MRKHIEFEAVDRNQYVERIQQLATEHGAAEVDELCHDGNCVTLIVEDRHGLEALQAAPDFAVLYEDKENQEWDGPDGPKTRPIILRVRAFGTEWSREQAPYLDRPRAVRNYLYRQGDR